MPATPDRSETVVESFKQRKLAQSALRRIHDLLEGFEAERIADRKLARAGLLVILLLIGGFALFLY